MNKTKIGPENTRVRKVIKDGMPVLQLLQASAETGPLNYGQDELADGIFFLSEQITQKNWQVSAPLWKKQKNMQATKSKAISQYITSNASALTAWKHFKSRKRFEWRMYPREWRTYFGSSNLTTTRLKSAPNGRLISIANADEIKKLINFADSLTIFIRQRPWAIRGVNDGKGPFEESLFEALDFISVHGQLLLHSRRTRWFF